MLRFKYFNGNIFKSYTFYRNVKTGDKVSQFDSLVQVQSDKATTEITSPYTGTITKIYGLPGAIVKTGSPLASIDVDEDEALPIENHGKLLNEKIEYKSSPAEETSSTLREISTEILATPKIKALAKNIKIDLSKIKGSGKDGRILESDLQLGNLDILNHVTNIESSKPDSIHLTPIQKAMFKTMQKSVSIPHFFYSEEIDMTELFSIKSDTKISITAILLKSLSQVIEQHPKLNCIVTGENSEIKKSVGGNAIGLAVDTPLGLVVPIISNISHLSIKELANALNSDIIPRARNNKLILSEINSSNACITLSNIGAIKEEDIKSRLIDELPAIAIPRILSPQASIVAITKAKKQNNTGRHIGRICWSADHRVIDGVTLARALATFKYLLENPLQILLDENKTF